MFHKFKITTCAFILCLFGLTLMTVSPVYAQHGKRMDRCEKMKALPKPRKKINCFRNEALRLHDTLQELRSENVAKPTRRENARRATKERKKAEKRDQWRPWTPICDHLNPCTADGSRQLSDIQQGIYRDDDGRIIQRK
jgi:hypothetical protein